ncbi:MAG: response regulator transcription factor [Clostridia bacterium]|nr:response regulator transcription factor [Clostridia bacterium]
MKLSVLVVEDEALMREVIKDYFESGGYEVTEAKDGLEAIELVENQDFDLILLDIMLPEIDGFSVCRKIRKTKDVPIIMITARSEEDDKLTGYELGADDYVTKPFSPKVLLAKANALIKRSYGNVCGEEGVISIGGITVNQASHTVQLDNEYIDLTPKEYDLLVFLMNNKGKVLSRDTLLSKVWGYDYFGDLRTVDTHIKKLRAKLGDKAQHIKTLIKAGYKFEENVE